MKELTKIEEILLLAIWRLGEEAYGVLIRQYVSKVIKKDFTYGNLYSALKQLSRKRYVSKRIGESTEKRKGNKKIYYSLTDEGLEALKEAWEMNDALWAGVSRFTFDK